MAPAPFIATLRWLAAALLGAALACAAHPASAQQVTPPDPPCNQISGGGTTVTCSGNVSSGVALTTIGGAPPFTTLNVIGLTSNITPLAGDIGVEFLATTGPVNLNIATGPFGIFTTDADGVFAGSSAGPVTVKSSGTITTSGDDAAGIRVGGQNDLLTVVSQGAIVTDGFSASGIAVSSSNGDIDIRSFGSIATQGEDAYGIDAGNIGGVINILSMGNIATEGGTAMGIYATSTSGPITINAFGNIATSNINAAAINAMSGGNVTINLFGNIATLGEMPDPGTSIYPIGALNGWSGAGDATITSIGNIATAGAYAVGISAVAGLEARVTTFGNIATRGDFAAGISVEADTSTVISNADIATEGHDAPGIVVQTEGLADVTSTGRITTQGGDAFGIMAASASGDVKVTNTGDITTTGAGAAAIYAQANGTVTIVNAGDLTASGIAGNGIFSAGMGGNTLINYGTIEGCPCAGVVLLSVAVNQLTNYGAIISDPAGNAIEGMGSNNIVDNYGIVTGNVVLDDGSVASGTFVNHAGALFNSGDTATANLVFNDGIIAPGGRGSVLTTLMSDDFVQGPTGIYAVDLDPAASGPLDRNDFIEISNTAGLAGKVEVRLLSLPVAAAESFVILQALSGVTDNGLGLIASPALNATLTFPNPNDVVLVISVDFDLDGLGLNPNQKAIAENLDKIFRAGVGGVGPVLLGLLNVDSIDEFKAALNQLSPELYSDAEITALYSSLAFSNSLLSCKVNGTDTASIIREGQCLWAGASAVFLDTGTTTDQIGFTQTAGLFTAGAQVALDNVWRLGAAAGYQNSTLQTAIGAQSDGALGQGGVALKYNPGPLLIAGTVSGGGAEYDTRRVMSFGGFTGVAEGTQDLGFVNGGMRIAYVVGDPRLYWKPILDANLTYLHLGSFAESGGNGTGLAVQGGGETVFTLAPTLEAGTQWWLPNGTLVRPLLRAGGIWYSNDDLALTASFESAPAGVGPFTINTKIDQVMGLVGAGLDVINGREAALRLSYDAQLGETTQIHSVGLKGSAKF